MDTDIFDAPPAVASAERVAPLSLEPLVDQPVVLHQQHAAAGPGQMQVIDTGVDALIRHALSSGADLDRLERLYRLKKEWEADEDKRVALAKLAEFKRNAPKIFKDKHVAFKTTKGVTEYDHATLGRVCDVIIAALADHGFTHSWDPKTLIGGRVSVTCILERGLWSRSVTLEAAFDDSGGKNMIQAQSSAITYLERYTVLAVTGMAVEGMPDDDGRATNAANNAANNALLLAGETILGGLLKQLAETKTDAEAAAIWRIGLPTLQATKSIDTVNEFRQRVVEHRNSLKVAA